MTLRHDVHESESIPQGYGVAWLESHRYVAVCYPVPLNVLVGWLRRFYVFLRFGLFQPDEIDAAFVRGYHAGQRTAFAIPNQRLDRIEKRITRLRRHLTHFKRDANRQGGR